MLAALVVVLALVLGWLTYSGLEGLGRRAWLPGALRAVAGSALGLLLINASCDRPPGLAPRPIALLDASLSMAASGADWAAARALAESLGEVRVVGELDPSDSTPVAGRSRIAPDLVAAVATGRPVWLVTDGEVEDRDAVPPDILARTGVRLTPRASAADLALARVTMNQRVAVGDTLRIEVEVIGAGASGRDAVQVDVRAGDRRWLAGSVALREGSGTGTFETVLAGVAPGEYHVEIALRDAADAEPGNDLRLAVVTVTPTPGIVVVASPPDWESRFALRTLHDVAQLPVQGYLGLGAGEWRRAGDLGRISQAEVEQAARRADVLVLFGDPPEPIRRVPVRGRWHWLATSAAAAPVAGDWYLSASLTSPMAGAFVALPVDSFPPAVGLAALTPVPGDWTALTAQASRRGAERPAVIGRDSAGRREVFVGAGGMWRWAFRGGASEQAYRAWVAATTSWLLGATDSATGVARPVHPVAQRGRPVIFRRTRPDSLAVPIEVVGPGGRLHDTLRFDGQGRAELRLPPGQYRYRLAGGGAGLIAVESYSDEYLRRPVVLEAREPRVDPQPDRRPLREGPWLFAIVVAALSGEWWWRRRAGLR